MDLFMSACLEFVALPKADCVPAMTQQGKIYDSAGIVFGQRSALSLLQLKLGNHLPSQSRYACFLIQLQWLVVDIHANRDQGKHASTSPLWVCKPLSMTQHILHAGSSLMLFAKCKKHNLHVTFSVLLILPKVQSVCFLRGAQLCCWFCQKVIRHPQLLAAKQRKGFPNMVKLPGCSAWRGVSTARGASCFFPHSSC